VSATFCAESCDKGPTVRVDGKAIHKATCADALELVLPKIGSLQAPVGN